MGDGAMCHYCRKYECVCDRHPFYCDDCGNKAPFTIAGCPIEHDADCPRFGEDAMQVYEQARQQQISYDDLERAYQKALDSGPEPNIGPLIDISDVTDWPKDEE